MSQNSDIKRPVETQVTAVEITVEEVNRVLEVGRLLFSVLTEEEKAELIRFLNASSGKTEIGNTGVT